MAEAIGGWDLKWELLVADTWDDPALKQRLLDDPATVLKERGISVPEGVSVKVIANDENTENLVLPSKPEVDELSDEEITWGQRNRRYIGELGEEELERVSGGYTKACVACARPFGTLCGGGHLFRP
jgi:hypothetical protein